MFTIKWNGAYSSYKVVFYDEWERLNSCNAATYYETHTGDGKHNALHHTLKYETWYLVSYASPIMRVKRCTDLTDGRIVHTSIWVNELKWNYSRTTIQHISRFCRNLHFFNSVDISYHEIKNAMLGTNLHFGFVTTIKKRMTIRRKTDSEMETLFKEKCPRYV